MAENTDATNMILRALTEGAFDDAITFLNDHDDAKILLSHRAAKGNTVLHSIASKCTDPQSTSLLTKLLQLVLRNHTRPLPNDVVNAVNFTGNAALHIATRLGATGVVKLLLEYGANVDVLDMNGKKPSDIATQCKLAEISDLLSAPAQLAPQASRSFPSSSGSSVGSNDRTTRSAQPQAPVAAPIIANTTRISSLASAAPLQQRILGDEEQRIQEQRAMHIRLANVQEEHRQKIKNLIQDMELRHRQALEWSQREGVERLVEFNTTLDTTRDIIQARTQECTELREMQRLAAAEHQDALQLEQCRTEHAAAQRDELLGRVSRLERLLDERDIALADALRKLDSASRTSSPLATKGNAATGAAIAGGSPTQDFAPSESTRFAVVPLTFIDEQRVLQLQIQEHEEQHGRHVLEQDYLVAAIDATMYTFTCFAQQLAILTSPGVEEPIIEVPVEEPEAGVEQGVQVDEPPTWKAEVDLLADELQDEITRRQNLESELETRTARVVELDAMISNAMRERNDAVYQRNYVKVERDAAQQERDNLVGLLDEAQKSIVELQRASEDMKERHALETRSWASSGLSLAQQERFLTLEAAVLETLTNSTTLRVEKDAAIRELDKQTRALETTQQALAYSQKSLSDTQTQLQAADLTVTDVVTLRGDYNILVGVRNELTRRVRELEGELAHISNTWATLSDEFGVVSSRLAEANHYRELQVRDALMQALRFEETVHRHEVALQLADAAMELQHRIAGDLFVAAIEGIRKANARQAQPGTTTTTSHNVVSTLRQRVAQQHLDVASTGQPPTLAERSQTAADSLPPRPQSATPALHRQPSMPTSAAPLAPMQRPTSASLYGRSSADQSFSSPLSQVSDTSVNVSLLPSVADGEAFEGSARDYFIHRCTVHHLSSAASRTHTMYVEVIPVGVACADVKRIDVTRAPDHKTAPCSWLCPMIDMIAVCPGLEVLDLRGTRANDSTLKYLSAVLKAVPRCALKSIHLDNTWITNAAIIVDAVRHVRTILSVTFSQCKQLKTSSIPPLEDAITRNGSSLHETNVRPDSQPIPESLRIATPVFLDRSKLHFDRLRSTRPQSAGSLRQVWGE